MSFEKKEWKYGDTIAADELNRMENGIEEAVECCGGGSAGYECTEEWVTLTDESVTTVAEEGSSFASGKLAYSEPITADTIKVTFNGAEYNNVPAVVDAAPFGTVYNYGAQYSAELQNYDFSTYPFSIMGNSLITEAAGTYQVKIEALGETVEASECFRKAVEQLTQPLFVDAPHGVGGGQLNTPFIDIYNAFKQGRRVIADMSNTLFEITSVSRDSVLSVGGSVVGNGHTYTASTNDAYPSYSNPIT